MVGGQGGLPGRPQRVRENTARYPTAPAGAINRHTILPFPIPVIAVQCPAGPLRVPTFRGASMAFAAFMKANYVPLLKILLDEGEKPGHSMFFFRLRGRR